MASCRAAATVAVAAGGARQRLLQLPHARQAAWQTRAAYGPFAWYRPGTNLHGTNRGQVVRRVCREEGRKQPFHGTGPLRVQQQIAPQRHVSAERARRHVRLGLGGLRRQKGMQPFQQPAQQRVCKIDVGAKAEPSVVLSMLRPEPQRPLRPVGKGAQRGGESVPFGEHGCGNLHPIRRGASAQGRCDPSQGPHGVPRLNVAFKRQKAKAAHQRGFGEASRSNAGEGAADARRGLTDASPKQHWSRDVVINHCHCHRACD
jgi:hypothetical protein